MFKQVFSKPLSRVRYRCIQRVRLDVWHLSVRLHLCTVCVVWLWFEHTVKSPVAGFHLGTFDILDPVSDFSMLLLLMLRVQRRYDEPLKLRSLLLSTTLVITHHHF